MPSSSERRATSVTCFASGEGCADVERRRGVAVEAVVDGRDVDVDDVAGFEHARARDAVADDLVHRGAHALREAVVVERRRPAAAACTRVLVDEGVDVARWSCPARIISPTREQRLGRHLARDADGFDLAHRLDADVAHEPRDSLKATASLTAEATSGVSGERCQWTSARHRRRRSAGRSRRRSCRAGATRSRRDAERALLAPMRELERAVLDARLGQRGRRDLDAEVVGLLVADRVDGHRLDASCSRPRRRSARARGGSGPERGEGPSSERPTAAGSMASSKTSRACASHSGRPAGACQRARPDRTPRPDASRERGTDGQGVDEQAQCIRTRRRGRSTVARRCQGRPPAATSPLS